MPIEELLALVSSDKASPPLTTEKTDTTEDYIDLMDLIYNDIEIEEKAIEPTVQVEYYKEIMALLNSDVEKAIEPTDTVESYTEHMDILDFEIALLEMDISEIGRREERAIAEIEGFSFRLERLVEPKVRKKRRERVPKVKTEIISDYFQKHAEVVDDTYIPKVNTREIYKYLTILHSDSNGYFTLASDYEEYKQKIHTYKTFTRNSKIDSLGRIDLLVSSNSYKEPKGRKNNLLELKVLWVDLNIYIYDITKEEAMDILYSKYIGISIPLPTFIIDTGRGLRVEFLLISTPSTQLDMWDDVQKYLYTILKPLGAFSRHAGSTTLNRVPGSINSSCAKEVRILEENLIKYKLEDIYNKHITKQNPVYNSSYQVHYFPPTIHCSGDVGDDGIALTREYKANPNPSNARTIVELLPKSKYTDALSYFKVLHGEKYRGSICIRTPDICWHDERYLDKNTGKWKDVDFHFYRHNKLPKNGYKKENMYATINTFNRNKRRIRTIQSINALYMDLDVYNPKISKKDALEMLRRDYFDKTIPEPSLIMDSGGGLYLIWVLSQRQNEVLQKGEALRYFKQLQDYLLTSLTKLGADSQAKDAARILRIPGSFNSKYPNKPKVKILEHTGYVYGLKDLAKEYVPMCVSYELSPAVKALIAYKDVESKEKNNLIAERELKEETAIKQYEIDKEMLEEILERGLEELRNEVATTVEPPKPKPVEPPPKPVPEPKPEPPMSMADIMTFMAELEQDNIRKEQVEKQKRNNKQLEEPTQKPTPKPVDIPKPKPPEPKPEPQEVLTEEEPIIEVQIEIQPEIQPEVQTEIQPEVQPEVLPEIQLPEEPIILPEEQPKKRRKSLTSIGASALIAMNYTLEDVNGSAKKVKKYNIKGTDKEKFKNDYSTQILSGQRAHDIELLCRTRNYSMESCRHFTITQHLLYLCYYYKDTTLAVKGTTELYNKIKQNNHKAKTPYTDEEFTKDVATIIKEYNDNTIEVRLYSNAYIVDQLNITDEECEESDKFDSYTNEDMKKVNKVVLDINNEHYAPHMLQLLTKNEKDVLRPRRADSRYYRRKRDAEGTVVPREIIKQGMEIREELVLKLTKEGKGTAEVSRLLNIDASTVKRHKRKLKEKGLL